MSAGFVAWRSRGFDRSWRSRGFDWSRRRDCRRGWADNWRRCSDRFRGGGHAGRKRNRTLVDWNGRFARSLAGGSVTTATTRAGAAVGAGLGVLRLVLPLWRFPSSE